MDLQFKTFPFDVDVKADKSESSFEGLVSVFHNIDSYGEIVDDAAFNDDLDAFMEHGFIGGLNHDWDNPIGKPMPGTRVTPKGLHLKGSVIDTTHGMDVRKMLAAGVVRKLSIGYRVVGDMMLEDADKVAQYWESKGYKPNAQDIARAANGARVLTRVHLFEGSPVTVPANDLAMITAVKAARDAARAAFSAMLEYVEPEEEVPASVRQFERFLRDAGLTVAKAKEAVAIAKTLLRDVASDVEPTKAGEPEPEVETAGETPEVEIKDEEAPAEEVVITDAPAEPEPEPKPELTPEEQEIAKARALLGVRLTQRQLELDARIAQSLSRAAGVPKNGR